LSGAPSTLVLPIFPLPDITFFPNTLLPLHVFEARYRAMVTDALAGHRRIAIVRLEPGYEARYEGKPAVRPVAGAGEIVNCERLPAGRYNILLRGLCRIRIERELPTDTLYRVVRAQQLEDVAPAHDVSAVLRRIRGACARLLKLLDRPSDLLDEALAPEQPAGVIADRVTAAVIPDAALRQELLEELDVGRRLERVADALDALVQELRGGRE
jgi:Lon protease-like protein